MSLLYAFLAGLLLSALGMIGYLSYLLATIDDHEDQN
jgi:preprotein translocase subunit Sss1